MITIIQAIGHYVVSLAVIAVAATLLALSKIDAASGIAMISAAAGFSIGAGVSQNATNAAKTNDAISWQNTPSV